MLFPTFPALALVALGHAAYLENRQATTATTTSSTVPQYFQTSPEIYAGSCHVPNVKEIGPLTNPGPTATGQAPFLAQSNPAPFGTTRSFVPNAPLETALPIVGDTTNASIFQLMGQLSPYFPNPRYLRPRSCKAPV